MADQDIIYVLNKRVQLKQAPQGFRSSIDSVLLAAACPVKPGQSIADLGCGVGTAGFCVLERVKNVTLTGIDIQEDHIILARENAALNGLESRTEFVHASILDYNPAEKFDHIICNPPFLDEGTHTPSPHTPRATAFSHSETMLEDWVKTAFKLIKGQGSLTMIHRADHTDKIIQALGKRFGAVEIIPLWPRTGEAAKRVIVRAAKHKKTPARLHPGLTLHKKNGDYTEETEKILRNCEALSGSTA